MKIKDLILILISLLTACQGNNRLPGSLKKGLLNFSVSESIVSKKIRDTTKTFDFGELWISFNKINARTNQDTLFVRVNVELAKADKYDGGIELARDTLFLYAKRLDNTDTKETIHSTLTYKILSKGLVYKEIEFKEI